MKVPKYVTELMGRAKYNYDLYGHKEYAVGYTIDIAKFSHYEYVDTLEKEINRLIKWCNRQYEKSSDGWFTDKKNAYILRLPQTTEYKFMQYATVTIYDPVMKYLEQYIKKN
jgi:hypothetical protein